MTPSPPLITQLAPDEVFVFGSNLAGRHGAGAAKQAMQWGARYRQFGRMGQTYGIPTKDHRIQTLPLAAIAVHAKEFLAHAAANPGTTFLVTEIGCGLAGYTAPDIAPMFRDAPANVRLPDSFLRQLALTL